MQEPVLRKLFLAFIEIHILYHASKAPVYGAWMIEELARHGYEISAGTIYPIFHNLEKAGLLVYENKNVNGKTRKYYTATKRGVDTLNAAKIKIRELTREL
jgi:PadR family transcriptional regulator PadR